MTHKMKCLTFGTIVIGAISVLAATYPTMWSAKAEEARGQGYTVHQFELKDLTGRAERGEKLSQNDRNLLESETDGPSKVQYRIAEIIKFDVEHHPDEDREWAKRVLLNIHTSDIYTQNEIVKALKKVN